MFVPLFIWMLVNAGVFNAIPTSTRLYRAAKSTEATGLWVARADSASMFV